MVVVQDHYRTDASFDVELRVRCRGKNDDGPAKGPSIDAVVFERGVLRYRPDGLCSSMIMLHVSLLLVIMHVGAPFAALVILK